MNVIPNRPGGSPSQNRSDLPVGRRDLPGILSLQEKHENPALGRSQSRSIHFTHVSIKPYICGDKGSKIILVRGPEDVVPANQRVLGINRHLE